MVGHRGSVFFFQKPIQSKVRGVILSYSRIYRVNKASISSSSQPLHSKIGIPSLYKFTSTIHWSVWCFGPVLAVREEGLSAALHSLRCWRVWRIESACDGGTEFWSVLGCPAAAAVGARGAEVGGGPCHPLWPWVPSWMR